MNDFRDKNILERHLNLENLSMYDVAKLYSVSAGTISYWIKKFHIEYKYPVRSKFKKKRVYSKKYQRIIQLLENRDWLYNEYIIKNGTTHSIAKMLGVAQSFVQRWLTAHNITPKGKGFAVLNKETLEEYAQQKREHITQETLNKINDSNWLHEQHITKGKSLRCISRDLNVSRQTVRNYCKKHKINTAIHYTSSEQEEIQTFISKYNFDICKNHRGWSSYNKKTELDIFIPKKNIAIEYHGLYWHSYDKKETKDEKFRHQYKYLEAEKHNIQLLQIPEHEWNSTKQDIWKSIILSKLNIYRERIYARKCRIVEIDKKTSNDFLEANHLQGGGVSKHQFGLMYNDEIMSVMTFGVPRFCRGVDYELLRFCNKKNTSVVGGASKLLSHFERKYKPTTIKSYANMFHSNGSLYKHLNFTIESISPPNYVYFKYNDIKTRYQAQKHKLSKFLSNFNNDLTEHDNMFKNGYRRFWDAGNLVYIKKYN